MDIAGRSSLRDETAAIFLGPMAPCGFRGTLADTWNDLVAGEVRLLDEYIAAQDRIDRRTCGLYGLTAKDWSEVEENVGSMHRPEVARGERARRAWIESIVSFLVGCAFGRWAPSRLTRTGALNAVRHSQRPKVITTRSTMRRSSLSTIPATCSTLCTNPKLHWRAS